MISVSRLRIENHVPWEPFGRQCSPPEAEGRTSGGVSAIYPRFGSSLSSTSTTHIHSICFSLPFRVLFRCCVGRCNPDFLEQWREDREFTSHTCETKSSPFMSHANAVTGHGGLVRHQHTMAADSPYQIMLRYEYNRCE